MSELFFVDIVNGKDTNVGCDMDAAFLTLSAALNAVVADRNDVIYILSTGDVTVINESITISKNTVHIKGEDTSVKIKSVLTGVSPITIAANGVKLSNLSVETITGGTDDAISVSSSNNLVLENIKVENATGRGVYITGSDEFLLDKVVISDSTSNGIEIADCINGEILGTNFDNNGGDNITITASSLGATHGVIINESLITESGAYGVNIGTDVEKVQILDSVTLNSNTSGNINDNGVGTYFETTSIDSAAIADAIWDETLADHTSVGSVGEALSSASSGGNGDLSAVETTTEATLSKVQTLIGLYFAGLK